MFEHLSADKVDVRPGRTTPRYLFIKNIHQGGVGGIVAPRYLNAIGYTIAAVERWGITSNGSNIGPWLLIHVGLTNC